MDENQSDPQIINRLSNQPPFATETGDLTEEQTTNEVVEEEQEVVNNVNEDEALNNSKNPERTKEYIDKLKAERDQAVAEAKHFESGGWNTPPAPVTPSYQVPQPSMPTIDPSQFPDLNKNQINETKKQLFDENGYVDRALLESILEQSQSEARAARLEAQQTRAEFAKRMNQQEEEKRSDQVRKVHKKFPELDAESESFNPKYWQAVRDRMVGQLAQTGRQDFYQAAKDLHAVYNTDVKKSEKDKIVKTQNQLRNISAVRGGGTGAQRASPQEQDALVEGTRKGTKGSLAERLKRAGY